MIEAETPKPTWQPELVDDVPTIASCVRGYTNGQRAFVVYELGTIVFSDSPRSRSDSDYNATLTAVVTRPPDFKVMRMEDGNLLVRFAGLVTGLVLADFYTEHEETIRRGVDSGGLLPGEQLMTEATLEIPESHYYAGLFARAKLYLDAAREQIVERFTP